MDLTQIVERIGSDNPPTIEELAAVREALETTRDEIAGTIRDNKGTSELSELRRLKGEYDETVTALASVNEAYSAAEAEVAEILATVTPAEPVEDADTDEEDAEEVEEAEAVAVPVAASVRSALARVRTRPVMDATPDLSKTDTSFTLNGRERESLDFSELGKAFADTARQKRGSKSTVLSIKTDLAPERQLTGDASANEQKMLDLFGHNPFVPVTAGGGCCSIPTPIYDQPLIGSLDRPIRNSMDVLQASRGAVQSYPPVCIPDEGADVWTCIQDAAVDPEDPDTWKSCTHIDCEDSDPVLVEAIYKCLTIGTYQQRFAPEQWQAFVFQTDKLLARLAEARLFGWLQSSVTGFHDGFATGSTYANFIKTGVRAAAKIRQEQRLGDAQLLWYGPDWIYSAMVEDSLTRRLNNVDEPEIIRQRVTQVLANEGITYIGSPDIADMTDVAYDGSLSAYPSEAPTVMLPAGSAKVLDGGEKNLGVDFVDLDLARQNNVAAFSEEWEGLLVRNCQVLGLQIPIEDCDTIPCPE